MPRVKKTAAATTSETQPQQIEQPPQPIPVVVEDATAAENDPQPGSHEHNNRALAYELEKLRQICQVKDERIIELNALNFEQRESNIRMAFALEEASQREAEALERCRTLSNEIEESKK